MLPKLTTTRLRVVTSAAGALVPIMTRLGYTCALSGDLACYMLGHPRVPKILEAVIFAPIDHGPWMPINTLKATIAQQSNGYSRFFLTFDRNNGSAILTYYDSTIAGNQNNTCTIELLYLNTTAIHLVQVISDLPFVPISYVLLRKLEEWGNGPSPLNTLTKIQQKALTAVQSLLDVLSNIPGFVDATFYPALCYASIERVQRYCAIHGDADVWIKLGFQSGPLPKELPLLPALLPAPGPLHSPINAKRVVLQPLSKAAQPEPLMIQNPTRIQMIMMAAKSVVDLLHKCGWASVIFGSVACFMYGNSRSPNDVDVLVLPSPPQRTVSAEDLKQDLVDLDPYHFFTTPAKDPQASYRVLYYRLTDNPSQTVRTSCKVDMLLPGIMHLPSLPTSMIHWDEGLPLIPFSVLLLQKLQAWDDHRKSKDPLKWQRQSTDVEDLGGLSTLSAFVPLRFSQPWSDKRLFDSEFQLITQQRVCDFCAAFPKYADTWASLGFETSDPFPKITYL